MVALLSYDIIKSYIVYNVSSSISADGAWITTGTFDASGGALPLTGGSGVGGAFKQNNLMKVIIAGLIDGVYVPAGSYIMAQQDDPTNDWDVLTGWVIK